MRDYTAYHPSLRRRFLTVVLRLVVKALLDLKISGLEHIPASGPVILISNHISFLDPVLAVGVLPRPIIPMSKIENVHDKTIGLFVQAFDALPIRRGESDRHALQSALNVLAAGLPLWISPEGTRSISGQLQPGLNGTAFIATRSGAPIVPIAFTGTDRFKHNFRQLKRTAVSITIGPAFFGDAGAGRARRAALDQITEEAMRRIAALLPPEMRGVYG